MALVPEITFGSCTNSARVDARERYLRGRFVRRQHSSRYRQLLAATAPRQARRACWSRRLCRSWKHDDKRKCRFETINGINSMRLVKTCIGSIRSAPKHSHTRVVTSPTRHFACLAPRFQLHAGLLRAAMCPGSMGPGLARLPCSPVFRRTKDTAEPVSSNHARVAQLAEQMIFHHRSRVRIPFQRSRSA
jgi:hypothetical protein